MPRPSDPTIKIRLAAGSEHSALESLQFAASIAVEAQREILLANPGINGFPAEQIAEGHVYVAERDGQVVGFSALLPREDGNAELDGLFVRPDVWRSGVGGQLMEAAEMLAVQRGATTLYVDANPHAVLFYQACGFEIIGKQPRDNWPQTLFDVALVMKKALNVAG
jgi:N-acetylglutamate synthase-like GNAT family acetyltransferase